MYCFPFFEWFLQYWKSRPWTFKIYLSWDFSDSWALTAWILINWGLPLLVRNAKISDFALFRKHPEILLYFSFDFRMNLIPNCLLWARDSVWARYVATVCSHLLTVSTLLLLAWLSLAQLSWINENWNLKTTSENIWLSAITV